MSRMHRLLALSLASVLFWPGAGAQLRGVAAVADGLGPLPLASVEPPDPPAPLVKIKVRTPACAGPERDLTYCILVENCSPAEAHHVVVKDPLPKNAKFVKADPEPVIKDGEMRWTIGTLGGGACREIKLVLRPTDLEDVKNCVRVQYEHGQCVTTRQLAAFGGGEPPLIDTDKKEKDKKDKDKKDRDKIPPPPDKDKPAKLKLTIDGPAKQYQNLAARYFVTVSNDGIGPAGNVLLTFKLAANGQFVKASDKGEFVEDQVAWLLGRLEVGDKRTVVVEVKSKIVGELCHEAGAKADGGITATATFCTTFTGVSALHLETFNKDGPIPVGGETVYPVQIKNTGTAPTTSLRLKAIVGDGLTLTRARGATDHKLGEKTPRGQELLFDVLPALGPGMEITYEVFVKGASPGDRRFRIELSADQLKEGGPVVVEESTPVYTEEGPGLMSRRSSRTEAYRPVRGEK
jgi:uncharacterized repeat protein (TIGR01451 family)